jgi:phage shock protein PspC (stress-responsive transcriptional regulator)
MLLDASAAFGQTFALLVTFLGVGVVANVLVIYIIAQVLAERRQNQERRERGL